MLVDLRWLSLLLVVACDPGGGAKGDARCQADPTISTPNDSLCGALDVGDLDASNPGPASSFTPCCTGEGEGRTCGPAACPEGEVCDASYDGTHVSDEGVGVCRRKCRSAGASWTCYGGCGRLGMETRLDCAEGEACAIYDFHYFTHEQPRFALMGLCGAAAPER